MKKINISEGVDRISELSDEVLGHILSLLPSKEAIATCLLSKRWRYVWKLVSALDFVCLPDMTIKAHTKVSEFLRLCGTKRITRFHVKCKSHIHQCWQPWNDLDLEGNTGPCCLYHIQEFVDAAIAGKVEQLSISMPQHRNRNHEPLFMSQHRNHEPPLFFVPTNLFNCATIVSLKLEGPFILLVPSCIQLPSLKSLHLNVRKCEPSLEKFLSGIPSLEVFSLKQVDSDFSLDFPQLPKSVHQLELHLRKDEVSLPITLLTCTTIVTVKIVGPLADLSVPSCVHMPSLKSLHLNVRKCERASCKEFFSGSPALEVFYLKQEKNVFEILKIERNSRGNLIVSDNLLLELVIQSDPDYDYVQDYLEGHLENLVKANVFMTLRNKNYPMFVVRPHALPILKSLHNVEFLYLNDPFSSMDSSSHHDHLPQFPNLVGLYLHVPDLHHSPYFKHLVRAQQCPKLKKYWLNDRIIKRTVLN